MKKNSDFTLQNFSKRNLGGFTLIELLVVIGILAILAGVVIVAVNPGRQFALTRNTKRQTQITQILSAIQQNKVENAGTFSCATPLPAVATNMSSVAGDYNIAACIVPTYIVTLPFDPSVTGAHYIDNTDYNTGYTVFQAASGQVTVAAPGTEIPPGTVILSQTQ